MPVNWSDLHKSRRRCAALTDEQAQQILDEPVEEFAKLFGVAPNTVRGVRLRYRYRHLTPKRTETEA